MVPHRTENCVSSAEVSGSWLGCPSPCPRPHCHGHGLIWRPLSHCEWLRICLGSGPRPHLSHSPTLSSNPNPAATSQVGVCRRRPQEAVRTPIPRQERRLCPAGCWSLFPGSLLSPPPPQSWREGGFLWRSELPSHAGGTHCRTGPSAGTPGGVKGDRPPHLLPQPLPPCSAPENNAPRPLRALPQPAPAPGHLTHAGPQKVPAS